VQADGTVRIRLHGEGVVTLDSIVLENNQIKGRSAVFSDITIPISLVREIIWIANRRAMQAAEASAAAKENNKIHIIHTIHVRELI
jgi:hypothetical protein